MKFWFDTEFIEDGRVVDLVSIGVVAEDGREFYAESLDADLSKADQWVVANVLPRLWSRQLDKRLPNVWSRDGGTGGLLHRPRIASKLQDFVGDDPEFWAYYADYDWVALCQLYGRMLDLPKGWPRYCLDVKQWCRSLGDPRLPAVGKDEHHALADARWTRSAWTFLDDLSRRTR